MSLEEIRNEKALALLEFKEAEDKLHELERQKTALANILREFATSLETEENAGMEMYQHISWQAACNLLRNLTEARKQFVAAKEKKKQFGL
jgi:hypothetical protein